MDRAFFRRFLCAVIRPEVATRGCERPARIRDRFLSVLIAAALLAAGGCASAPLPPPSEEVRANLGRVGILSGTASPSGEWNTPAKGGTAGAGRGAATGLLMPCAGYGCALNPLSAIIGGIVGAATAEPAAVVEEAEATIQTAFADLQIPDTLRDRVVQAARAETRHTLILQTDVAAADAGGERPGFAAGLVDTVLQISIQGYGTKAAWAPNPPVFLFLDAQVSLLRVADGTVLHRRTAAWVSAGRPLAEWAVEKGNPVRQELERGIQYLAERIVDVVFLLRAVP
jgi:hypothetical protein